MLKTDVAYDHLKRHFDVAWTLARRPSFHPMTKFLRWLTDLFFVLESNDRELNRAMDSIAEEQYAELDAMGRSMLAMTLDLSRRALSYAPEADSPVDEEALRELRRLADYWEAALEDELDHENLRRLYQESVAEFGTDALEDGGFAR